MYFGTDGIRGIANLDLTCPLALSVGNALASLKKNCRVLIGMDTRVSGDMLLHAVATGVMQGGGDVLDVGVMPTAGIAYLTRFYKADYGVVMSASHNPAEYNGIKVFDADGYKLGDKRERDLELRMANPHIVRSIATGKYMFMHDSAADYVKFLLSNIDGLKGLRVLVDCSNGAAGRVAKTVFEQAGASVVAINTSAAGIDINENAGALYASNLAPKVKDGGFDVGFAYDGDADRLIAVDENGNVVDGDHLLYILACEAQRRGHLETGSVVGTHHTNMGVQEALENKGIKLVRADIGDKYVLEQMLKDGSPLGAEQSGHIILGRHTTTGDGILASLVVAQIIADSGKTLSQLDEAKGYAQVNINVPVSDKLRIINSEAVTNEVGKVYEELAGQGRVLLRASGTEPKIRIMVECKSESKAKTLAKRLESVLKSLR
ncbi:MAG TPA: phosphoglucosamine mutase [Candidatus Ornithoclostridium faecavium]|nr:phosphoglucosamine mutase [Candidatus Ornithoclostridium faecavium]